MSAGPERDEHEPQHASEPVRDAGARSTLSLWRPKVQRASPAGTAVLSEPADLPATLLDPDVDKRARSMLARSEPTRPAVRHSEITELNKRVYRLPSAARHSSDMDVPGAGQDVVTQRTGSEITGEASRRSDFQPDESAPAYAVTQAATHTCHSAKDSDQAAHIPRTLSSLFRSHAVRALDATGPFEKLPSVTGTGWGLLAVLGTLLTLAAVVAYVSQVEQTSLATGVLIMRDGPRPVVARATGPLLTLLAKPGSTVQRGQVLASVDASELRARAARAAAQLAQALQEQAQFEKTEQKRLRAERQALQAKRSLLGEQTALKENVLRTRRQRHDELSRATADGLATAYELSSALEAVRTAQEELLQLRTQAAEVQFQLATLEPTYEAARAKWQHDASAAASDLAETKSLLQTTDIRAPISGVIESLQVTQGQSVTAGDVVARIVPAGSAKRVIAFAPVVDASFLREDLPALIEFASLPVAEFGRVKARIARVARDVSSPGEVAQFVSEAGPGPFIRVELELLPSEELAAVHARLRSGERLSARITTRRQRLITLLFEFLRRWVQ